ncbi:hypothetical protein JZK55_20320 [Dissulfurispira thermophila]|uniref:Uncharacterized protein n=2 Tax=root TaxID=1 RepID=A0A7G1H2T6_9BACT|nr:hypothetical protein [Dissulfurispira thermophila]BCB97110.1 hypothetical protein JZK55_20320 [Dissulfurispira thermophila]
MKKAVIIMLISTLFISMAGFAHAKEVSFTQEDRDRLIRLETTVKEFKESVDKRFEQVDKRFEQVDKRFEQVDKRFEQVDKRFEQMFTFLWILTGIFTAIMVGNIGFAYWDRRTIIRRAKEETIAEIEKEGRLKDMIGALRDLSKTDEKVARVLKQFNLL